MAVAQTNEASVHPSSFQKKYSFANVIQSLNHFQVDFAAGPTWYRSSVGHVQVTQNEQDSSVVNSVSSSATYRAGVGYHLLSDRLASRKYFNDLLLQLNWYTNRAAIKGDVWQSGLSNLDNYTFRAPISSNRWMLDVKPGLFTFRRFSPYPILGVGVARTQFAYYERPSNSNVNADSFVNLKARMNTQFAYDYGFGLQYAITQHLAATAEYIHTNMSNLSPSKQNGSAGSSVTVQNAPRFSVYSQNLLFGLSWKF